jgi:hypothetical protein
MHNTRCADRHLRVLVGQVEAPEPVAHYELDVLVLAIARNAEWRLKAPGSSVQHDAGQCEIDQSKERRQRETLEDVKRKQ